MSPRRENNAAPAEESRRADDAQPAIPAAKEGEMPSRPGLLAEDFDLLPSDDPNDQSGILEPSITPADLDYRLPEALIAQQPAPRREDARLLHVDRASGQLRDRSVRDLPSLLNETDLLVLNNTRVLPAKFVAHRATGGAIEGLYVGEPHFGVWRVMLRGARRVKAGETLTVSNRHGQTLGLTVDQPLDAGHWLVRPQTPGAPPELLERFGRTPLPPYIRRVADAADANPTDRERYQTVYARRPGAVAAPTAGLHLTDAMIQALRGHGVDITFVTLHVGLGTFKPIAGDDLAHHKMHEEWFELPPLTADAVSACRARNGRVVAVGTTCVRVLEASATEPIAPENCTNAELSTAETHAPATDGCTNAPSPEARRLRSLGRLVEPMRSTTDIFIYPPYRFRVVDALMTNFHLPRSTLLALIMAMAGTKMTQEAYAYAVEQRYRFFSYGDAMFIS